MGILVQFLVGGRETYMKMLDLWYVQLLIHLIIFINSFFLLKGENIIMRMWGLNNMELYIFLAIGAIIIFIFIYSKLFDTKDL